MPPIQTAHDLLHIALAAACAGIGWTLGCIVLKVVAGLFVKK